MIRHRKPPAHPSEADIVALVERANPIRDGEQVPLAGSALDARVAAIAEAIAVDTPKPRFRRRRAWISAGAIAAIVGGGGAITWAVTRHSPAVYPTNIICYDSPAQNIGVVVSATGEPPVDVCARVWLKGGDLGSGGSVPNLVACVGSGGAPAVYASDDAQLCEHMDLAVLDDEIPPEQLAIIAFRNDITDELVTMGCVDQPTLIALIEEQLRDKGIDDVYSVRVLKPTDDKYPCAGMGPNEAEHTIDVMSLPDIFDTVPSS